MVDDGIGLDPLVTRESRMRVGTVPLVMTRSFKFVHHDVTTNVMREDLLAMSW